jgi:hypothetical protein
MTVIPFPRARRVPVWLIEAGLACLVAGALIALVIAVLMNGVLS